MLTAADAFYSALPLKTYSTHFIFVCGSHLILAQAVHQVTREMFAYTHTQLCPIKKFIFMLYSRKLPYTQPRISVVF
jgi:hypothetical protein